MLVYSKKIIEFVHEIKTITKEVLSQELRLKVFGDRFYDKRQAFSYPIHVVIYNNRTMLGYFDSEFYELGFHESLMGINKEQLKDIIRHEIAHFMTFINYRGAVAHHGPEFRAFCQNQGWGEEVYRAKVCLENESQVQEVEESSVLRRIKKLMALSESQNENEAELAMLKSQQLLLKHNIDPINIEDDDDNKMYLKRTLKEKRKNAKMASIGRILPSFFVSVVYNRQSEYTYLEILGTQVNVEIAEYVANFLDLELDVLWDQARRKCALKGAVAKNSFFLGIAKGYCDKINSLKRGYNTDTTAALMVIEKKLEEAQNMAYARLVTTSSSRQHCPESASLGEQAGKQLNINPALNNKSKKSSFQLTYF